MKGGNWGFINPKGEFIIKAQYHAPDGGVAASPFSEGLAKIKIGGLWGFLDRQGKLAIPARYQSVGRFSGGLAQVFIGQKLGYINRAGKFVWIPQK
jgi:hypothetical protein